jgi:hypothetical protein
LSVRGAEHREAILAVVRVFGPHADNLVFAGSCVLALYARPRGHALSSTKDVDCIFDAPVVRHLQVMAELGGAGGPLTPVTTEVAVRYQIKHESLMVDVMDLEGRIVGGSMKWLGQAVRHAQKYDLTEEVQVRAITPPYFLVAKLDALRDRGKDPLGSRDLEDIVAVAVEVPTLVADVRAAGLSDVARELWEACAAKLRLSAADIPDLVAAHIGGQDTAEQSRVERTLEELFA